MLKAVQKQITKQLDNYDKPTPKKWRKLGRAIFGFGTVITVSTALFTAPWVPVVAALVTWAGTTITDLATE